MKLDQKTGARRTTYRDRVYHSAAEARYAARLDLCKSATNPAGRVFHWEPQVAVPLVVNGIKVCTFVIDFLVTMADGTQHYAEVKGWEREAYKLKLKLFKALYPNAVIKIIPASEVKR